MKELKNINVNDFIKNINIKSDLNNYYSPQIEIIENDKMSDFLLFCDKISEYSFIDQIGGIDDIIRYRVDKKLKDVIHKSHTSIGCGIKIVKYPLSRLNNWDKWENGYIEGFARMDSDDKNIEWVVWQYIKMDKLEIILNEFKKHLFILE